MQIGDEVIWSAVSAIVVGLTLKSSEFFMSRKAGEADEEAARKAAEEARANEKMNRFHDTVEDEVVALREEVRKLKEESDNYRRQYFELLERKNT